MSIDAYVTSKIQKQTLIHSWRTSIQETIQGNEKRSALLTWPRIKLDSQLRLISTEERNFIRSALFHCIHKIWGFPFVHDKTLLTEVSTSGQKVLSLKETSYRHFYSGRGLILVYPSNWTNYEYCVIDTVDSDTQITVKANLANIWLTGTSVYPLYEYRINEFQEIDVRFRQMNFLDLNAAESFESTRSFSYSIPSSGAAVYNDLDLFLTKPLYPLSEKYNHSYSQLAFLGLGHTFSTYGSTRSTFSMNFVLVSREEIWSFLEFFDAKQGRFQSFYIPTWDNDIVPTSAIEASDTSITVEQVYLTSDEIVDRHLYIRFPDKSYVCRKITDLSSATSITLDSAIGTDVLQKDLSQMLVSFLYEVRFDADEILFEYVADEIVNVKLPFKTL